MKTRKFLEQFGMATLFALVLIAAPVRAATLETEEIVYEVEEVAAGDQQEGTTERFVAQPFGDIAPSRTPIASFGPFHMVAPDRAELIGSVESETPAQFAALLRAFPALKQIDMVDCPGTGDDGANLALARMVRRHGVMTYVPEGGSVRSGGVELFLAGARRRAAPTAEFAVHSWRDEDGYEASDFAADDPVHQEYIAFYREMGLSEGEARNFYAMTNSAPHDDALYLNSRDLARYVRLD
ncbi:hypothetical protein [Sphingorhabdus sp.]|uniref:hypothetical protein n=1 Tax=Sphingorhabdus sp. TaxID=1902408 RepID=UPI0032B71A7E